MSELLSVSVQLWSQTGFFRMGKITTNPKSIESRERKAENAAAKKAAILKAKEDASWEDNDKQLARKADRANAAVSQSPRDPDEPRSKVP